MISQVLSRIFGLGVVVVVCLQFISKRVLAFWSLSRKYNKNALRAGVRAVNLGGPKVYQGGPKFGSMF